MGIVPKSRVRIESDGTPRGTRVLVDGVPLNTVTKVSWSLDVNDQLATCTLELVGVDTDVVGEGAFLTALHQAETPNEVRRAMGTTGRRAELTEHGVEHLDLKGDAG